MDDEEMRGAVTLLLQVYGGLQEAVASLRLEYYLCAYDGPFGRPWAWGVVHARDWEVVARTNPNARKVSLLDTFENACGIAEGLNATLAPAAGRA